MRVVAWLSLLALACGQPAGPGPAAAPVALPTPRHRPAPPPPEPPTPKTLSVKVVDERGRPVAQAAVRAVVEGRQSTPMGSPYGGTLPVETDAAGVAVLSFPDYAEALVVMASRGDWPLQSVAVDPRVAPTIVLGPPRTIPGHLALTGCPSGALTVEVSSAVSDESGMLWEVYHGQAPATPPAAPVAADGRFSLVGLGPGPYRAGLRACGRGAGARFTGRDKRISLTLAQRPADQPSQAAITVTTKPLPAAAPCQFKPWSTSRLVAGEVTDLYLDGKCRLFFGTKGGAWSMVSAGGQVIPIGQLFVKRLPPGAASAGVSLSIEGGAYYLAFGESTVALHTNGLDTRVVSLATGKGEDLGGTYDFAFAPASDVLAFMKRRNDDHPAPGALELRLANGTRRLLAPEASAFAWIDDGRLAYLAHTAGAPSILHLYDPKTGGDHELGAAKGMWPSMPAWYQPLGRTSGHLVVASDSGALVALDLATLTRQVLTERPVEIHAIPGAVLYEGYQGDSLRSWLWDAGSGATTDVSDVIGYTPYNLRVTPAGDLLLSGRDVALASDGKLRVLCESAGVLEVAGGAVLCREIAPHERVIAVPLDGKTRGVGLAGVVALSPSGAWAHGRGTLASTDGKLTRSYPGLRGSWAPDRDVFYYVKQSSGTLDVGPLVALDAATGRDQTVAPSVTTLLPLDHGRVLYAVPGDGVYLTALP